MGKAQKKTGKGRLDKYYKLAKEQGYRARSAFKLIQLNKKYSFLENSRCTIDLCAAPGGWLQVASKYMPANSVIVGVDLVPIKPIPRVVTFATDITTPHCRNLIRGELKDWKADVVLHDGAPNVGTAWIQDAYSQSELVLMSLKLAVEFLMKGGTFITKVFRSVDYNNLIWVFNQLFGKVEATKPPSSRNVSAEIFVVCRDFLAPKQIDPKFLDPRHVFKDLAAMAPTDKGASSNNVQANVFHPEKKRRKRDGYADGDYTLFKTTSATEFVHSPEPIAVLGTVNQITFTTEEEKRWLSLDLTSEDIKANCDDLKVLGKGDFKALMKWRVALREELGLENKEKEAEEATEVVEIVEDVDEDTLISEELERLNAEAAARAKRERRRANELKTRAIQRMQLQMTAPMDIGMEQHDASLALGQEDMFDLEEMERDLGRKKQTVQFLSGDGADMLSDSGDDEHTDENAEEESVLDSDEERNMKLVSAEAELDELYETYRDRLRERDAKRRVKEAREKNAERGEWNGIDNKGDNGDLSSEEGGWEETQRVKSNVDQLSSDDSQSEDDEDTVESYTMNGRKRAQKESLQPQKRARIATSTEDAKRATHNSAAAKLWFSQDIFGEMGHLSDFDDDRSTSDGSDTDDADLTSGDDGDDFEIVPQDDNDDVDMWDANGENAEELRHTEVKKYGLVTAEAVTLAQQLINREKTKTQLINDGFNRFSLNSKEGLPSWFLDDESHHYKPNLPITKEAIAALRAKQRALDARPIKKVAEAKARKKFKAAQRLEKAMKKAEGVNATADLSEREKAQQIEKLMRKGLAAGKKTKKEIKVVVAKGAHKGIKGRPKGVKGRYAMVDARMKKEMRAKKRKDKENKKRR